MKPSRVRRRLLLLSGCVLALAAWFLPSQFSAERFRARIEAGLQAVLHRPASFGSASFQLLPRPRFTLENVVIHEDPAFGFEPFARIDRIECDLRWSSVWRRKMDFENLRMSRLSLNLVRDSWREWNIETFLTQSGVTAGTPRAGEAPAPRSLDIEVDEARLNFKQGNLKSPFALVEVQGRLEFDPGRKRIRFDLGGNPWRTDLTYPTPGLLEISGEWQAAQDSPGVINASLRTRGALLYNWIPLITGVNRDIYGVLDADVSWQGPLSALMVDGQATVSQLHRADMPPPSEPLPVRLRYRGKYDSTLGRLVVESAEAVFADSNLHLTGTVDKIREAPDLDLVIALEHSQLEDLNRLARRIWRLPEGVTLAGRLDGLLTVQGQAGVRRYGGFITGRGGRLLTPAGAFPFSSDIALRLDPQGARLDRVALAIAPRCVISLEGEVLPARAISSKNKIAEPPRYEIRAETRSADLREVTRFTRILGIPHLRAIDAQGLGSAALVLKGTAWPGAKPSFSAVGEIRSARLLVPGLTEPLNVPRARFSVSGPRVAIDSLTAVLGSSIFTGRVEHSGPRTNPWEFDLAANSLSVEQGAAWFDALGHRPALTLLERIPGLSSITTRRSVATGLFNAVRARGRFSTPLVTYRSLRLQDFQTSLALSERILELSDVSFRAGKGRGEAAVKVDMSPSPAEITGELKVSDIRVESLANYLPPSLAKLHGGLSGGAQFQTRGLSRTEMGSNLTAEGTARLEKVGFGEFDPMAALVKWSGQGGLERARRESLLADKSLVFSVRDRQVIIPDQEIDVSGVKLRVDGRWTFNGPIDLEVRADLRDMKRTRAVVGARTSPVHASAVIHLTGRLKDIQAAPGGPAAVASRSKVQ